MSALAERKQKESIVHSPNPSICCFAIGSLPVLPAVSLEKENLSIYIVLDGTLPTILQEVGEKQKIKLSPAEKVSLAKRQEFQNSISMHV